MRKLDAVKSIDQASKKVLEEFLQKGLAQNEQRRNDLLPEYEKMSKMSQNLQSLEDRLAQSQNNTRKLDKRNEQARIEMEKLPEEMGDHEQKIGDARQVVDLEL